MSYDILIVGSGIVGSSLAVGLKNCFRLAPIKIGLVDPGLLNNVPKHEDHRTIALSSLSCQILKALSLRDFTEFAYPIHTVHVSEQGRFAVTRLKASDIGLAALGYSIEMPTLTSMLQQALDKSGCELIPAYLKNVIRGVNSWKIRLETSEGIKQISAKLLIAADGERSLLRKLLNIPAQFLEYGQSAMVTTVETTKSQLYMAFERFIPDSSIALLPIGKEKFKLVWIAKHDVIEKMSHIEADSILNELQKHLGYRLGKFHTLGSHRHVYPLRYLKVENQVQDGFVLMGNAAHVLHPIAAQGFNLSVRDTAVLIEVLHQAFLEKRSFESREILENYFSKRRVDQNRASVFTQCLASFFARDFGLINSLRSTVFNGLEFNPFLKRKLLHFITGSYLNLPRWVFDD